MQQLIELVNLWHFLDGLDVVMGDVGTAVEVNVPQLGAVFGQGLDPLGADGLALANVETLEVDESVAEPLKALVGDGAVGQGQGFQVVDAVGHVLGSRVSHVGAEGDVETLEALATNIVGQVPDAQVTDVITRAQVDGLDAGQPGQRLETSVGDTDAKAQVDPLELSLALANGSQAVVSHFLTVLKTELFKFGKTRS